MTPSEATEALQLLVERFRCSYINCEAEKQQELVTKIVGDSLYPILLQYPQTNFYRVREGDTQKLYDDLHFYSNAKDFSFNPDTSRIGIGRCNHPGVQVLYCAFEERTAQYEAMSSFRSMGNIEVNIPHIAYIGRWQSTRELRLVSLIDRQEDRDLFVDHYSEWSIYVSELITFLRELYVMQATDNPSVYSLTATISEAFLKRFDGIAFPSSSFLK